ncbi:MAG: alpha-ketoglutarate-dependent dioxygenase AlkB [Myxococcales bacterium]|nr:alpha-ketoglutarate-dependent dioxygenase AlkB [Myxococcales bacterium]
MREVRLGDGHVVLVGNTPMDRLPDPAGDAFDRWWSLRPTTMDRLTLYGRSVALPRWQRAYGRDYHFSGQTSRAHPVPEVLEPGLAWARSIEPRVNGLLLNWYDAAEAHYIGPHRDSRAGLVEGAPILTLSLGAQRTFRLRPYKGTGKVDVVVGHGDVVVIPWQTNLTYTHEVPHFARDRGRRISLTARAFDSL